MKNKYFILAITFLCLLMGQSSFGQLDQGDFTGGGRDNVLYQLDASTGLMNPIEGAELDTWKAENGMTYATDDTGNLYADINNDGHFDKDEAIDWESNITNPTSDTTTNTSNTSSSSSDSEGSWGSWGGGYAGLSTGGSGGGSNDDSNDVASSDNSGYPSVGGFGALPPYNYTGNGDNGYPVTENNNPSPTNTNDPPLLFNGGNICVSNDPTWYLDKDGDGYDDDTKTAATSPGSDWVQGMSKGKDCDDSIWSDDNINCTEKKPWYLDNDGDGWHSQVKQAKESPGTKWKDTTNDIDCNDARYSLANDCSKADPCAEIQNILNYKTRYNSNLKTRVDDLKSVVNRYPNLKEEGYEITKNMNFDETYRYGFDKVLTGTKYEVGLQTAGSIIGGFHSHPSTGVPIFSFQDLRHLLHLYEDAKPQYKQDVFDGVVAKDAQGNVNVYILKVDDIAKLKAQVNAIWTHPDYAKYKTDKTDKPRIKAIHDDQAEIFDKSNGEIEKSFLEQFPTAGISIYKADASVSSFSKLTLNNSVVTPTPCN